MPRNPGPLTPAEIKNPGNRAGGRKKGTPNRLTKAAKDAIQQAFDNIGGVERLVKWIEADPLHERLFWTQIYPKLLPHQVNLSGDGSFTFRVKYEDGDNARVIEHKP